MHRDLLFQCYNTILQYSSHRPWPFEDTPHTTYNTHGRIAFGFLIYCYTYTYTYFNLVNNSEVFKWWWIFISAGSVQKPFNTSGDDGTKNQGKAPHSHINAWSPHTQPYLTLHLASQFKLQWKIVQCPCQGNGLFGNDVTSRHIACSLIYNLGV